MAYEVVFAPEAEADLLELYDFIAERANSERAFSYTNRLRSYCLGLSNFPERGRLHSAVRPGLRTIGFQRRATIAFHVSADFVVIDRILHGGRALSRLSD